MHSPELTQLILVGPAAQEWVPLHCALVSHLPQPSLTLLALTFPYTTVLVSKECQPLNVR